jgi:hypothetical protein
MNDETNEARKRTFREATMNRSNIRNGFLRSLALVACSTTFGCSDDPVAIGDGPNDIDKTSLASYAADWDGYVEAYTFRSGSDRVRVSIDQSGEGFLQVGEGDALPLPTDPAIGWPPMLEPNELFSRFLYDGVRYPLGSVRIESARIRFEIETHAAFATFCEMQTPVENSFNPGLYGCFETNGYRETTDGGCIVDRPDGSEEPVDCAKVIICSYAGCACDASSCTSAPGWTIPIDAALDDSGDELVGSIVLTEVGDARTIRLRRQ